MILDILAEKVELFLLSLVRGKGLGLEYDIVVGIELNHVQAHEFIQHNTGANIALGNVRYKPFKGIHAEFIVVLQQQHARRAIGILQVFVTDPARHDLGAYGDIGRTGFRQIFLGSQAFYILAVDAGQQIDATVCLLLPWDREILLRDFHVNRLKHVGKKRVGYLVGHHKLHQRLQDFSERCNDGNIALFMGVIVRHEAQYNRVREKIPQF